MRSNSGAAKAPLPVRGKKNTAPEDPVPRSNYRQSLCGNLCTARNPYQLADQVVLEVSAELIPEEVFRATEVGTSLVAPDPTQAVFEA